MQQQAKESFKKTNKKQIIVGGILIIILFLIFVFVVFKEKPAEIPEDFVWLEPSERAGVFRVGFSSLEGLPFTSFVLDPIVVSKGEIQVFGAWMRTDAEIESMIAEINTDRGSLFETMDFYGEEDRGNLWLGKWRVHNVSPEEEYEIVFTATDKEGKEWPLTAIFRTIPPER